MLVVDASVVVHILTTDERDDIFRLIIAGETVAPHVLDLEVIRGVRRALNGKRLTEVEARAVIADLVTLPIERYPHAPLIGRIWELRRNVATYDAAYVALAEHFSAPLLTRDRRLVNSSGHTARIEYID